MRPPSTSCLRTRAPSAGRGSESGRGTLMSRIALVEVDDHAVPRSAALPPPELRTLDAIHLATALSLGEDLGAICDYDSRLADATASAGWRSRRRREGPRGFVSEGRLEPCGFSFSRSVTDRCSQVATHRAGRPSSSHSAYEPGPASEQAAPPDREAFPDVPLCSCPQSLSVPVMQRGQASLQS
jgi:hypothetical protein